MKILVCLERQGLSYHPLYSIVRYLLFYSFILILNLHRHTKSSFKFSKSTQLVISKPLWIPFVERCDHIETARSLDLRWYPTKMFVTKKNKARKNVNFGGTEAKIIYTGAFPISNKAIKDFHLSCLWQLWEFDISDSEKWATF